VPFPTFSLALPDPSGGFIYFRLDFSFSSLPLFLSCLSKMS